MKWEYWVETINTEYVKDENGNIDNSPNGDFIIKQMLNAYGKDGWELVGFLPALPAKHFKGDYPNPWVVHAICKKPRNT